MSHGKLKSVCLSLIALACTHPGLAEQPTVSPKEALMLRRVTEYWQDGDYTSAKQQILDFLDKNPQTSLRDYLSAMLGDIYFQERAYPQALATYDLITSREIRGKTFFNNLQAHFELKDYIWVIDKAEHYLKTYPEGSAPLETKVRYLLAEAAFREALRSQDLERRHIYLKLAKPQLITLAESEYKDRALFPLAETHRLLKEDSQAANLYLQLAHKYPAHRERFLFQAAILQINEDKREAIKTFHQIYQMGGKRAKLAVFNELILLYQTEQYEKYTALFPKVIEQIPNEKVSLLQFYEGRSFYSLGNYEQAINTLESFVDSKPTRSRELKTAYLILVNSARQLKDWALLERTIHQFKAIFPKDQELAKMIFTHAQICRENGNFSEAIEDFKQLIHDFPQYEEKEQVLYDMGLVLEQTEQLQEARKVFLSFIERYPQSPRHNAAWRHLINCSIEELKNPKEIHTAQSKEDFVRILDISLKKKELFNEKERKQYEFVQARFLCDLGRYQEAIALLDPFILESLEENNLAEAHLLMAFCLQQIGGCKRLLINHGEKALSLQPHMPGSDILHLELYNTYLDLASSEKEKTQKEQLLTQAANHLFESNNWKNGTIHRNNLAWLTQRYFEQAKTNPEAFKRASALFDSLLSTGEGMHHLRISSDSISLENEVLKYAYLLGLHNCVEEEIALLEALVRRQEAESTLPWKLKKRAILELAKAYECNTQYENALRTYQFLSGTGHSASSAIASTAQLHLARLQYQLLPKEKKRADHPDMINILHRLKDLQIQKRLPSEPVHLEAALQYAELRSALADPEERATQALFFLQRMQKDFNSSEDVAACEYNSLRERLPEKDQIVNAYMHYIEAEMLKWQAKIAREENDEELAAECEEQAVSLLDQLLQSEEALRPYLLERVKQSRSQIAKL